MIDELGGNKSKMIKAVTTAAEGKKGSTFLNLSKITSHPTAKTTARNKRKKRYTDGCLKTADKKISANVKAASIFGVLNKRGI